ncbi:MAG: outer membrane beta-barrel protein [Aquabacterium sp.]|jgi:OOP family OmpA-OmpF porin
MIKHIAAAAMVAFLAGGASAQVYVGGALGTSKLSASCSGTTSCDTSDGAWKLYVGNALNDTWAVEVAYLDFGKAKRSDGVAADQIKASALVAAAAGRWSFAQDWSAMGRLGLAYARASYRYAEPGFSFSESDSKIKAYVGLGLAYSVTPNLSLTLDADFTTAEVLDDSGALRAVTLGAAYRF